MLDETVNTAASTAESGAYHMRCLGDEGGEIRSKWPHPVPPPHIKLIHKHNKPSHDLDEIKNGIVVS